MGADIFGDTVKLAVRDICNILNTHFNTALLSRTYKPEFCISLSASC